MADCLTDPNPDYCTIMRALGRKYIAAIMRYRYDVDQYVIHVSFGPVRREEAERMAQRWAAAHNLEYRP